MKNKEDEQVDVLIDRWAKHSMTVGEARHIFRTIRIGEQILTVLEDISKLKHRVVNVKMNKIYNRIDQASIHLMLCYTQLHKVYTDPSYKGWVKSFAKDILLNDLREKNKSNKEA
jgi:hypothetical protein